MTVFSRFPPRLQAAIANRLGWHTLREVQEQAGEAILDGKNAVVLAPTAGGKTEASVFPMLAQLIAEPKTTESVRALYIAPIKALLNNQADRLGLYTEMVGLERFLWHGDVGSHQRKQFLREPADLLMTTPESLEVMLVSRKVPAPKLFADLRYVIIDEIHAMAGEDRGAHLMSVLERLQNFTRHDIQRIGLSATVGNPEAILTWLQGTSKRPPRASACTACPSITARGGGSATPTSPSGSASCSRGRAAASTTPATPRSGRTSPRSRPASARPVSPSCPSAPTDRGASSRACT